MTTMTMQTPIALENTAEEAQAAAAALTGGWLTRARIAFRALLRLNRDPNDTRQVFVLSIAVNAPHLPKLLMRFLSTDEGMALLHEQPSIDSKSVDLEALRALPEDTLGGAYIRFLDRNKLDPDLFQAPPGLPRAVAYVVQRLRQQHDLWHVLTGYTPDVAGELPLLGFSYAQTGAPALGLLAAVGSIRHSLREKNLIRRVLEDYRRGKRAAFLPTMRWEGMWHRPLAEVRRELGIG
jgi:ubiquinone biosynthesis protein COQ4